jgi:cellulose synthase/poly-beta-1,6-N-acetylglucosamine synthase-like glycosyltransferase
MDILARLRALGPRVEMLRTPQNRLKAGALNLGLAYLLQKKGPHTPAVILTLDDDVRIGPSTIERMVAELLADPGLGAVCSRAAVLNKNKNILTRLQGLEYVGFNAIRLADRGFLRGPLVMHGMLTAFRARALRQAGLFAEHHLIEDYEMTTRLKTFGWDVRAALSAPAWTEVPDTFAALWRQRTRWSFGGLQVVLGARDRTAVLQDILGHSAFVATLAAVAMLLVFKGHGGVPPLLVRAIVGLSLVQLVSWYALQLWLMRWYAEKDAWDWLLRASLIPELLYSNIMTVVLIGSYLFLGFTWVAKRLHNGRAPAKVAAAVARGFKRLGYSGEWGTRAA